MGLYYDIFVTCKRAEDPEQAHKHPRDHESDLPPEPVTDESEKEGPEHHAHHVTCVEDVLDVDGAAGEAQVLDQGRGAEGGAPDEVLVGARLLEMYENRSVGEIVKGSPRFTREN